MGRFAQLVREITPNWLHSRSSRHEIAHVSPSDADFSWQEAIDNKMYGADTSDYSHVPEKPVSAKPTGDRPADENDRVPKKAN
ncbi:MULTISPECIES: hypothetical protein [unclassified Mesorhizobium]|uniref:hypothetical protein n=1 Tax=unclassified Mesorhizobium TaxID=325217 RepID=UPI00333B1C0D